MAFDDRFRPPAEHEKLIAALTGKDGPFHYNYEALLFAAALGKRKGRRVAFEKAGEKIRYGTVENRAYGDVLIDLLAVTELPEDAKILADERLQDRLRIFEEYANGGLHYLQGAINGRNSQDLVTIVSSLVLEALKPPVPEDDSQPMDMLDALEW
jgi:dnd system-associated protein 4